MKRLRQTMILGIIMLLLAGLASAQTITLEFWEGPPREGMYEALEIAIQAFKEKHPNVQFNITQVPWAQFAEKFQMGSITGNLPDISDAYASLAQSLYGQGITMPLNDVVEDIGWDKFSEWTQKLMMMDGDVIGIPYINPPHVLWYRKDLFEEKGLDVPKTWSEWLHAAKELTIDTDGDGKPDIYGMLQYLYDTEPQAIRDRMYTSGASTFDENGNVAINSPAMKASVDFLKEIWKYSQPGAASATQNDARILFMAGHGAMIATSVSLAAVMAEQAPELRDKIGVAPIPKWEEYDGPWTGTAAYNWWVVSNSTEHPELIKDFLRTFFDPEVYLKYSQTTYRGWLPVLLPTQQDPEFFNHPRIAPYADYFKVALEVSPGSVSIGQEYGSNMYGGLVDAEGVYKGIVERAVLNNWPTERVVQWAEDRVNEIVESY